MRQPATLCSTAARSCRPSAWGTVRAKSHRNSERPRAAKGTRRALTSPLRRRPQTTEPVPTPTEKNASMRVNTGSAACRSSRTRVGSSVSSVAPTTQNQLRPRMQSQTGRLARATRSSRAVSVAGFQPMRRSGAALGACGMNRALTTPPAANRRPRAETIAGPWSMPNSALPAMVPARMPRKVPASISPLPDTSSASARWTGRIAYFSGPKNVACTPRPNNTANSRGVLASQKPRAAAAMSATSASLTQRIVRAFSNRSAICPAVAESST